MNEQQRRQRGLDKRPKKTYTPPKPRVRYGQGGRGRPESRSKGVYGSIPASVNTNAAAYDGTYMLPGFVGGGNAAQAQSLNPSAPAYIKPTPTYTEDVDEDGGGGGGGDGYTGRDTPAPAGGGAKGTNTGYKIDLGIAEKYAGSKIADVNNFLSTQLPVGPNQKSSAYDISEEDYIKQAQAGGYLDTFRGKTYDEAILHAQGQGFTPEVVVEGSSTPGETSFTPADIADNKRSITIDRTGLRGGNHARGDSDERFNFERDYGDYEGTKYSPVREARRAAFLSGDDGPGSSLRALKRADASVGRVYAGGKNYFNDGGTLREVTSEAGRKQAATGLTAEELKDAYIKPIKEGGKEAVVPTVTKDGFEPSTQVEGVYGEIGSTKVKPINGISFNQQTEFNFNNAFPVDAGDNDFLLPGDRETVRGIMKRNYFNAKDDDDDE